MASNNDKPARASILTYLYFVILTLATPSSFAASTATLDNILAPYKKVGVSVYSLSDKREIYAHNAHDSMIPASTMKVVTSVSALKNLKGSFVYKTKFTTNSISRGAIQNLYIKGSGDPSLTEERVWRIAKDLNIRGIKEIRGDIVIDNSYISAAPSSTAIPETVRAYSALTTALAVNFNSFAAVAKNTGGLISVTTDPPTDYFVVKSNVRAGGNGLSLARQFKEGHEYVTVSGGVSTEVMKYASVANPVLYAGTTFKWLLAQNGIQVLGRVRSGAEQGSSLLFTHKSDPLSLIIHNLNKWSNNFSADMLMLTMGAVKSGSPGTVAKGIELMRAFLSEIGVSPSEYHIVDGSGLSTQNRLSPSALVLALITAYEKRAIRNDFIASLAIGGVDGTLKKRMQGPDLMGNVKAKTGTLSGVSSLAGYLTTARGNTLAFSILVNAGGNFHALQEKFLIELYKNF